MKVPLRYFEPTISAVDPVIRQAVQPTSRAPSEPAIGDNEVVLMVASSVRTYSFKI